MTDTAARAEVIRQRYLAHGEPGRRPRDLLEELVAAEFPLLDPTRAEALVEQVYSRVAGLGPIDELLADESITDILVNGSGPIHVERAGQVVDSGRVITDREIALLLERAFGRTGLSIDRAHPIADTRLADGARISAVLAPVAVDGPQVAIRRFATRRRRLVDFCEPSTAEVLERCVVARQNIVAFGSTGSGKTSLLGALASAIDPVERVITIEDAAELQLGLPHTVRLECRPPNGEGAGLVDMRMLVRAALRLRPDRIVVGEVRGPEALDMIWALATGHTGCLSTCHARTPADALARLETFVMLADSALPLAAVRAQVRSAIDVVVGVERRGPTRSVVSIHRVVADPEHPDGIAS